ncbi:hypothetical protein D3C71_971130 [compost metagenome]
MASTSASPRSLLPRSLTKERSILSLRTGNRLSWLSDEYPVPKSSMASCTPSAVRRCMVCRASSTGSMIELSVISNCSNRGGHTVLCKARATTWSSSGSWN